MKTALSELSEKGDSSRLLLFWNRMFRVMIGLCIALAFSLGWNILQWQENKVQDHKLNRQEATLLAIEDADHLAKLAAYKTCVGNLPRVSSLFTDLVAFFNHEAAALKPLLASTPKGSKTYDSRHHLYKNNLQIANDLHAFLPIKCSHTKDGRSRG